MKNSLEYYRQAAADSDDSDCDLLVPKPIFESRKKRKQNENDSGSSIVSLSQSSLESNVCAMLTKEQVETKAREMVRDLKYPGLGDTNRLRDLGWHKCPIRKGGKECTWYPCRLASDDETIGLFPKYSKGKLRVRYLGYQSDTATQFGEIKSQQYIPLTADNKESGMDTYIRHLENRFKDDVVACRAEVLAVLEMWKKVEERELELSKTKSSTRETTKKTARVEPSASRNTNLNGKLLVAGESSDDGNSDSDIDVEDKGEQNTGSRKRPLRAGDIIEYFDPIGVVGKAQWLKTTKILGVDAKSTFPLNLENGDVLDRTIRVKRMKRLYRQKLETCEDAVFKDMAEYGLKSGGTMETIGLKGKVEKAKRIRNEFDSQVQDFWKGVSSKETENSLANSGSQQYIVENGVSVVNQKNRQLSRPLAMRNQNTCKEAPKRKPSRIQEAP